MKKARITFSTGEMLDVKEGETFIPFNLNDDGAEPFEIYNHHHDGLVTPIAEMCIKSVFFFRADNPKKVYKSSSVVSIEEV